MSSSSRSAVRAGNEIILISEQNTLRRLTVEPLVSDESRSSSGSVRPKAPEEGEVLCLTPIPFPADGARVLPTIDGQKDPGWPSRAVRRHPNRLRLPMAARLNLP